MHPRYQIPGLLTVLLLGGTVFSVYGEIVVNWDDGFEDFTDFSDPAGTEESLLGGAAANNDGDLVELGFFSNSDDSNLFRGNWIPLTSTTTIGDSSDGTSLGDGAFSFQTKFADADGDATTFFSSSIKDFTVTNGGSGYTSAPTVIITRGTGDSSGSGAVAIATLSGDAIGSIAIKTPLTVGYGGSQYTVDPTVVFSGGGGSGATATADRYDFTDQNTAVRSVEVTNGGSGYTENFAVTFTGGGGSGATGEAIVSGGVITKIVIRDPGTGYTSLPALNLTAGDGSSGAATASFLPQAGQLLAIRFYEESTNASGNLFNTVAAPSTTPGWNAWPSSDTSFTTPNLSADTSLTGLKFQTDEYTISSKDLITSIVDIGSALEADPAASLYTTGNADGGTLTANVSGSSEYSGIMADGLFEDSDDGKLTFVKTGAGTLKLDGEAQTYSGDTTISAGGLTLTGSATIANTSNIYLSSGTTLTVSGLSSTFTLDDGQALKGTGSVVGDVIFDSTAGFQDGSTIAPGDTASDFGIGRIDVTGAGTWNAGTTYQWEINDLDGVAGDDWDYLTFTGALIIDGNSSNKILIDIAALDGFNSPFNQLGELGVGKIQRPAKNRSLTDGYQFAIAHAAGGISGDSVSGAGVLDTDHFEIEYTHFYEQWDDPFHNWNLSIVDGTTLYLTYSAVPEPSTYVMVGGLLVLPAVTLYRRWKKKKAKATEEEENLKDA